MLQFTQTPVPVVGLSELGRSSKVFFTSMLARLLSAPLFLLLVVVPSVAAIFYFGLIAAPMYVSEAQFVVRSSSQPTAGTLDSVLAGVGFGTASTGTTDAYVVHQYVMSRDAVRDLQAHHDLRALLARSNVDMVSRYPRPFEGRSFEDLYQAYTRFVTVGYNSQTGISTLRVKAFRAEDAAAVANALLDGGEAVVNRLNERAAADALNDANRHVRDAETEVVSSEAALTQFRNRERLIDPARSSLAQMELVGKLETVLATLRAQRAALSASAPESPQLPVMDQQIQAFEAQADAQRTQIAGQDTSLAPMIGEYERLVIDRDFAAKELTVASASAEEARLDLNRKKLYLERVVSPNVPDSPRLPKRLYSIGITILTCLLIYGVVVLIIAGLREHGQ